MKSYIISVLGATILGAMASVLSPERWRQYVKLISGLVILCCLIAPAAALRGDGFKVFDESVSVTDENGDVQLNMVKSELKKRISGDIEKRLREEFHLNVRADCEIDITGDGKIKGVKKIYIRGARLTDAALSRLCEVYGVKANEVKNE